MAEENNVRSAQSMQDVAAAPRIIPAQNAYLITKRFEGCNQSGNGTEGFIVEAFGSCR